MKSTLAQEVDGLITLTRLQIDHRETFGKFAEARQQQGAFPQPCANRMLQAYHATH